MLSPITITSLLLPVLAALAPAQVQMTTQQALRLAFPGCKIQRSTATLEATKRQQIERLCGQKIRKSMVFPYQARRRGVLVGTAWFDVHKVRSKQQLLMVVIDPQQRVQRVEVLAFAEPRKYRAPKPWLRRFQQQRLDLARRSLRVPRITGATLTVRASTRCVHRILATHRVVFGAPPTRKPTTRPSADTKPR